MNAASVLLTGLSLRICFTEELGCAVTSTTVLILAKK